MRPVKLYQQLASSLQAMRNCAESGNDEWRDRHAARVARLVRDRMPSGSGFDSGTQFDECESSPNKLIFRTSFHHMHESGMYDGWTDHAVIVTPDLASGFSLRITGRGRNAIKNYIAEVFDAALQSDVTEADILAIDAAA